MTQARSQRGDCPPFTPKFFNLLGLLRKKLENKTTPPPQKKKFSIQKF